jgi:hypothetical protein
MNLEDFYAWLNRSPVATMVKNPVLAYVQHLNPGAKVACDRDGFLVDGARSPWPEWAVTVMRDMKLWT